MFRPTLFRFHAAIIRTQPQGQTKDYSNLLNWHTSFNDVTSIICHTLIICFLFRHSISDFAPYQRQSSHKIKNQDVYQVALSSIIAWTSIQTDLMLVLEIILNSVRRYENRWGLCTRQISATKVAICNILVFRNYRSQSSKTCNAQRGILNHCQTHSTLQYKHHRLRSK